MLEKYREVKQVDGVISASVVEQWNTSMDEHKLFEKRWVSPVKFVAVLAPMECD